MQFVAIVNFSNTVLAVAVPLRFRLQAINSVLTHQNASKTFHSMLNFAEKKEIENVLTELSKQGYSFVSVNDLIYKDNYYLDHTGKQHKNT